MVSYSCKENYTRGGDLMSESAIISLAVVTVAIVALVAGKGVSLNLGDTELKVG